MYFPQTIFLTSLGRVLLQILTPFPHPTFYLAFGQSISPFAPNILTKLEPEQYVTNAACIYSWRQETCAELPAALQGLRARAI